MFRQLKNYLLYDTSPEHSEFLTSPGGYLRKLLFDDASRRHRPSSISSFSSLYPPTQTSLSSPTQSVDFSLDMMDDGHPGGLGNAKILRQIFKYLCITDLVTCRVVCLRWNVIATSFLRKKLDYIKVPPSKMKAFNKLMQLSVSNPFSSYAIRINIIQEKHTKAFLTMFSLQIINLRVRLNITEIVDFAKHLQNMRNLKRLHVIVFEDGTRSNSHFIWNSSYENINVCDEYGAWKMGLYAFTNITHLTLENAEPTFQIDPFYDRVVANIITACGKLKVLRLLSWNSPLGKIFAKFNLETCPGIFDAFNKGATAEEIVTLFFATNLRFHHVNLEVTSTVSFDLVTDVIHRCGDSLNELAILNDNPFEKFVLSSSLRSLVKLRLGLWHGAVDFTDLEKQLPALKAISLNLSNLFEIEQMPLAQVERKIYPCETVRTLTLTRLETGVDAGLMEKLGIMFPSVKELFVEVKNGKAVEKIYQIYPDLTLLSVELNRNNIGGLDNDGNNFEADSMTNNTFTGIPDEEIKIVDEMECGCHILEFSEDSRSCWNIGCLRGLTTLLIRVPKTVDNITLLEGLSRLEHLRNLVLLPFYSEDEEPIKWCVKSIADSFPVLQTLVTSTEVEYSTSELQYVHQKLPNLIHRRKE